MKNRKANRSLRMAMTGLLFLALCLAPAAQLAGDNDKRAGALEAKERNAASLVSPPTLGRSEPERFNRLLSAGYSRSSAMTAMNAQSKGDSGLAPEATYTFENSNPISIPDSGAGTPYPLNIRVSNIPADPIFKLTVSIQQIQHTYPDDLDILLVGPQGQKVLLMSDAGGDPDITLVTLSFSDTASSFLPDNGPLVNGFYKPTNYEATADTFPAPAPAGPYSSTLSVFNGSNPLGFWNLYVFDDAGGDSGTILLGWSLTIETLAVTNTNDSGPGSLRQAIINANANADLSTIPFRIPGTGPFGILLSSTLPTITSPVILDATTQSGYAGTPLVQISGGGVVAGNGLTISSGGSTVKGLGIVAFQGSGILLDPGGGNTIQGCYIGLNIDLPIPLPNSQHGIDMGPTSSNNLIGGTTAAARNVISGNGQYGIVLGSSGQIVQGNYIGTNAAGTAAVGNAAYGIGIFGTSMTIGGTTAGARNVISGNHQYGMVLGSSGQVVQGNYIGTDFTGTLDLGNARDGIAMFGFNAQIGGSTAAERNVISGNNENGIQLAGSAANNVIEGNYIGTDASGISPLGNTLNGVLFNGTSNNSIGGTTPGDGNRIAFNLEDGVFVLGGTGNPIVGNSIFGNGGLGIDLAPNGVTVNDAGDTDSGANNLQNFPVILSAIPSGGGTLITGVLLSTPNTSFRIEFFANPTYDSTFYGEGQTFLGSTTVITNGTGDADINYMSAASVPIGQYLSATATRNNAPFDTSEFSQCLRVTAAASDVTSSSDSGPGSLRQAIVDANATAQPTTTKTITFNLIETTITLSSPLPAITVPVIIDGTTQPGYAGAPIVEINGANIGTNAKRPSAP